VLHPEEVIIMAYNKPLPKLNSDAKPFWDGCKNHELRFQQCQACGHVRWPSSIICPKCNKRETRWVIAGGHGTIYTYAVYHIAYHPGFSDDIPYVVAIVELDEGPHLLTNIINCNHQEIRCGMDVIVVWDDVTPETTVPKFRPV
jgi:uncharacterized protein